MILATLAAITALTVSAGTAEALLPVLPVNLPLPTVTSTRERWSTWHVPAASARSNATAVAVSPDGARVFSAGDQNTPNGSDVITVADDAVTGRRLWSASYAGAELMGDSDDRARAMAVAGDGSRVFILADSQTSTGGEGVILAYDTASGAQLWAEQLPSSTAQVRGLVANPDGSRLFVASQDIGAGTDSDIVTRAYAASDGHELWMARYDGPTHQWDAPYAVAISPDGSQVIVTGERTDLVSDGVTLAYGATTGAQQWEALEPTLSFIVQPVGVAVSANAVFVTGDAYGGSVFDTATVAYSRSTGARLWTTRYANPANVQTRSIAVSPDGARVFVTGASGTANSRGFTLGYDAASGATHWFSTLADGSRGSYPVGLVVSPDNSTVYLAATVYDGDSGGDRAHYSTTAYNAATGATRWSERFGKASVTQPPNADDAARGIAIAPAGDFVYVTGSAIDWNTTFPELTTVAYSTGPAATCVKLLIASLCI